MKKDINNYGEILASIDSCTQNFFAWYFWQNLLYILAPDWLRIKRSIARSTYDRGLFITTYRDVTARKIWVQPLKTLKWSLIYARFPSFVSLRQGIAFVWQLKLDLSLGCCFKVIQDQRPWNCSTVFFWISAIKDRSEPSWRILRRIDLLRFNQSIFNQLVCA